MRLPVLLPLLIVLALSGSTHARDATPVRETFERGDAGSYHQDGTAGALLQTGEAFQEEGRRLARPDFRRMRLPGPFPAEVLGVIDGDTFEARVTVWLGHEVTTRVRLLGIDAAEMGSGCREEQDMAQMSRAALIQMLGRRVLLSDVRFDKYGGRVLARALGETGIDVSSGMLAAGYAIVYDGGRRQAWCAPLATSRK